MRRLTLTLTAALGAAATACAVSLGGARDIELATLAIEVAPGADPAAAAAAVDEASPDMALVAAGADSAWFAELARITGLPLSGPGADGDLGLAFLGDEPVGDTTLTLAYDGGALRVHDALYEMRGDRFLDLMAYRLDGPAAVRPAIRALLEYMATDVMNSAAVVMAVVVPTAAVGDSVRRMLSPAYFDALRCEPGLAAPGDRAGIRLFYGPEARVYCRSAEAGDGPAGSMVRAELVLGRR